MTEGSFGVRHYVEKNMKAMVKKKKRVRTVNRYGRMETHMLSWWLPGLGGVVAEIREKTKLDTVNHFTIFMT